MNVHNRACRYHTACNISLLNLVLCDENETYYVPINVEIAINCQHLNENVDQSFKNEVKEIRLIKQSAMYVSFIQIIHFIYAIVYVNIDPHIIIIGFVIY